MFIEKRVSGKSIKYYLVYSYRNDKNDVIKIRRYLGLNLSKDDIERSKIKAQTQINSEIKDMKIEVFNFSLSKKQMKQLNRYNDDISILHLQKEEWARFTEEFVYNTNAIEGSIVSKNEVHDILEGKSAVKNDEIETKNVAKAVEFIRDTKEDLSLDLIKKIHKLCFNGSRHFAGKLRDVDVVIEDSNGKIVHSGTPVPHLDFALKEYISWYKKNKNKFKPLILAALVHNQFENIHPFQDGNGRVGRLLLNFILIQKGYPPINILLEDRKEYYHVLQEYSKNHNITDSLKFLIKQYKKTLRLVTTKKNIKHNVVT